MEYSRDHFSRETKLVGDHLSMGTELVGDRLSRGTNQLGTSCGGPNVYRPYEFGTKCVTAKYVVSFNFTMKILSIFVAFLEKTKFTL